MGSRARKTPKPKRYLGIDGESIDNEYIMLTWATDDGERAVLENDDHSHLSTKQCLAFITDIPKGTVCWGFAFGYDVNMLLGDLTERHIARLRDTTKLRWGNYRIEYIPTCMFRVSRVDARGKTIATTTVWDLWKWVQTSFVKWIGPGGWDLAPPDVIERMTAMKLQRSVFGADQWDEIRSYNLSECEYMATGARRLCELIAEAGVNVRNQYHSAAALAKAMMRANDVLDYRADPPEHLAGPILDAYVGGRAEVSDIGPVEGPIYSYDINSAYPSAAVNLPCLKCGRWRQSAAARHGRPVPWSSVKPWSLVRVSWRPVKGRPKPTWGPLCFKPKTGFNSWPTHGTGWYWGVEVLAARRHATIVVKDCWTYSTPCEHKPFGYLADLYDQRRALKAANDPTEFVLKGALNSTYGALAEKPKRGGNVPRYRCMAWAGWITAATRAALLDALTDDVILMATDGILSKAPIDLPLSKSMGEWEAETYDEVWIAGTGIYFCAKNGVWEKNKTRGFESGQLTREMLLDAWDTDGRVGRVKLSRTIFIGMGIAMHRVNGMRPPHARLWRKFISQVLDKTLDVTPRRAWRSDDVRDGSTCAPSAKASRQHAKVHAALVDEWRAEYVAALAHLDSLHGAIARKPDRTPFRIALDEIMEDDLLDKLLLLATLIDQAEGNVKSPLLSADADDPNVG